MTAHPSPARAGMASRLAAGAVPAILASSAIIGTAAWLGRTREVSGWPESIGLWLRIWGAYAVWATIVTVPAVLVLGWPLDRLTAGLQPLAAALRFAALGLVTGAVAGFAILASIDAGWVGAAVVAPIGAIAAFVGRLLVEPLARHRAALLVLSLVMAAVVLTGVANP
jgi:hypothetical protein